MPAPTILSCHDRHQRQPCGNALASLTEVPERFTITTPEREEFARAVEAVIARRGAARADQVSTQPSVDAAALIDTVDILILDADMASLRLADGDTLAYLARCYTTCGYIVVCDQFFASRTFDTTMQRGWRSWADLHISTDCLARPELWLRQAPFDGAFIPSHWPRLIDASELFANRLSQVQLDADVLDTLGFSQHDCQRLTVSQLDLFGDVDADPTAVTFDQLVAANLGEDRQPSAQQRRRIAASIVGRWLDRLILPAANVLLDRDHLQQYYPELVPDETGHGDTPLGVLLSEPARRWFTRPACSQTFLQRALPGNRPASYPDPDPWVFCEDTSRFIPLSEATDLVTDLPGDRAQRFVERLDDVDYHPAGRLLPPAAHESHLTHRAVQP
jgi:DNA-directed RNA polymerase subunit N (RpoN/RPB10)